MKEMILIVEDDPVLLRGLKDNLEAEDYRVMTATDGQAALQAVSTARPDLILLDVMLPKLNGYEVCRQIRRSKIQTPILMLTAKTQEADIVLGLNIGADEYVTKPFGIKTLLARIDAMLRRQRLSRRGTFAFGPYQFDPVARQLKRRSPNKKNADAASYEPIELTPKESAVLAYLLKHAGRAVTRENLLQAVWGFNKFVTGRSVDRCITTLRGKLEGEKWIRTVREVGYCMQLSEEPGGGSSDGSTRS